MHIRVDDLLPKLSGVRKSGKGYVARCPAHDDKNGSLSIWTDEKGATALHCFAGCARRDICAALGIQERDLYPDAESDRPKRRLVANYDYYSRDGKPIVRVVRYEPKQFLRMSPDGHGGWQWGRTDGAAALYRWPELASACAAGETILLVEGEKDVDNLVKAGASATTTCLGGASKWRPELAAEFKGAAMVYIIADRDDAQNGFAGQKFALKEKADIEAQGVKAKALCLPAEVNGRKVKDTSDALSAGWTLADIEAHCESCDEVHLPPTGSATDASQGAGPGQLLPEDAGREDRPDPADAATLREAVAAAVVQASWYDSDGRRHSPNAENRRAAIKRAGVEWLFRHGGFFRDTEGQGSDAAYYYESATRRLYAMASEEFALWLGWASGLDEITNDFRTLLIACKESAFYDERSVGVVPSLFWDWRDDGDGAGRVYVSNGDGEMARVDEAGVSVVENGTDGVLFRMGRTCAPWKLLPEEDGVPMHSMRLVGGISTPDNPLAPLLLLLWILSLPRNLKNKPPLSLCGEIGSGKTRSARGIYEMFGMVERVSSADKSEKGEEQFWVSVGYGGISTVDNVDSKIKWLADAVAGSSTGAQKEKRTLYTDSDLTFHRSRSAVILTSANSNYATDAGLADRLINVVFARPTDGQATSDGELSAEIAAARDGLMTWLCYTISHALRVRETPPAGLNRRHPDWAAWCWRCGVALGYREETEAALARAESDKAEIAVRSDQFVGAVLWRMLSELGEPWEGTAAQLREFLLKGGGDGAGHAPGTMIAFEEGAATPEEYDPRARESLTARHIGNYFRASKVALEEVFGLRSRISGGSTLWRLDPPAEHGGNGGCGVSGTPFLTFIIKNFSNIKVKNGGVTSTTSTTDTPPDEGGPLPF